MGHDFAGVRVHTGATAAKLSGELNARAFTVGRDVAFGAGEYHPGTPAGDALIAHELAHVAQQGGSYAAVAPKSEGGHDGPLEAEADNAAVGAVLSMWGGVRSGALGVARHVGASLKSGLKLQRCTKTDAKTDKKPEVRPGQGLDPGLPPGVQSKGYSLNEYIRLWEAHQGHKMSADDKRNLVAGCIGVTTLNLGGTTIKGMPDDTDCYDSFDHAKARADEVEKTSGKRPFIFSKRFWAMGRPFPIDSATGKVDMRNDDGSGPPGHVNFDYGFCDEVNKTWWHANHCDPSSGCGVSDPMKVYQSTLQHYSDPNYFGADTQVFCVAASTVK
jgi:hypothetical protein